MEQQEGSPLKTMERSHTNMQDIRNRLGIKRAICGWLPEMEHISNQRTKIRTTPYYWLKLVKEAGIEPTNLNVITANRNTWKEIVRKRNDHLAKWETSRGNRNRENAQDTPRNMTITRRDMTCPECEKICKTAVGSSIHIKRMHRQTTTSFNWRKMSNRVQIRKHAQKHQKRCQGERKVGSSTQCSKCVKIIQSSNFARHPKKCCLSASEAPQPRKYKARYVPCPQCEYPVAVTILARHLRACRARREESAPSARRRNLKKKVP